MLTLDRMVNLKVFYLLHNNRDFQFVGVWRKDRSREKEWKPQWMRFEFNLFLFHFTRSVAYRGLDGMDGWMEFHGHDWQGATDGERTTRNSQFKFPIIILHKWMWQSAQPDEAPPQSTHWLALHFNKEAHETGTLLGWMDGWNNNRLLQFAWLDWRRRYDYVSSTHLWLIIDPEPAINGCQCHRQEGEWGRGKRSKWIGRNIMGMVIYSIFS